MTFQIGQTFTEEYPPEVAVWCNENNAYIVKEDGKFVIKAIQEPSLEELKEQKIKQIDKETSNVILAGFDYTINGTSYHFSYDFFDQQNFSDTANMCQLALAGTEGLPSSVVWNSYLEDGTLVQQTFDAQSFLALYTAGAMQHKATQMTIGGQRKAKVWEAQTKEEIEAI